MPATLTDEDIAKLDAGSGGSLTDADIAAHDAKVSSQPNSGFFGRIGENITGLAKSLIPGGSAEHAKATAEDFKTGNYGAGALGIAEGIPLIGPVIEQVTGPLHDPAQAAAYHQRTQDIGKALGQGHYGSAALQAAEGLPVAGPMIERSAGDVERGDYGAIGGDIATLLAPKYLPPALSKAAGVIRDPEATLTAAKALPGQIVEGAKTVAANATPYAKIAGRVAGRTLVPLAAAEVHPGLGLPAYFASRELFGSYRDIVADAKKVWKATAATKGVEAADAATLEGLAQGMAGKAFAKLTPEEQVHIRDLADRIKNNPSQAATTPASPAPTGRTVEQIAKGEGKPQPLVEPAKIFGPPEAPLPPPVSAVEPPAPAPAEVPPTVIDPAQLAAPPEAELPKPVVTESPVPAQEGVPPLVDPSQLAPTSPELPASVAAPAIDESVYPALPDEPVPVTAAEKKAAAIKGARTKKAKGLAAELKKQGATPDDDLNAITPEEWKRLANKAYVNPPNPASPGETIEQVRRELAALYELPGTEIPGASVIESLRSRKAGTNQLVNPAVTLAPPDLPAPLSTAPVEPSPVAPAAIPEVQDPSFGAVIRMPTKDINADPVRFQYKTGMGQGGAGSKLRATAGFDRESGGVLLVWKDPLDGKTYVVNGHHRLELAKRVGEPEMDVRYTDAKTAGEARVRGALMNIREGQGTAVDAAHVFRETGMTAEDLAKAKIPMTEGVAREGLALSQLDPSIFSMVATGEMPVARGVAIGEALRDPVQQKALVELVNRAEKGGKHLTNGVIGELIRNVNRPELTRVETQTDLFGESEMTRTSALERAEISDYIKKRLGQEKRLFATVATEGKAQQLSRAGNVIQSGENAKIAQETGQAQELYNRLSSSTGPIDDILNESAVQLSRGGNAAAIKERAYEQIRAEIPKALGQTKTSGTEGIEGSGSEGAPPSEENDNRPTLFSGLSGLASLFKQGFRTTIKDILWLSRGLGRHDL